ncbi:hypothetical protein ACOSQ2_001340 [Xanthoceras sorbifolium]
MSIPFDWLFIILQLSFSIESDAVTVINCLNSSKLPLSEIGVVLADILTLVQTYGAVVSSYSHVPRSANKVAHTLAKTSFDFVTWMVWVDDYPYFIANILAEDVAVSL